MSRARAMRDALKAQFRPIAVDWESVLEANYLTLVDEGASVIDVGANVGRHARVFARQMKPRHMALFEPIPRLHAALRDDPLFRDHLVSSVALGAESGERTFYLSKITGNSGLARLAWYAEGDPEPVKVQVRPLDDLPLGFSPDYIKMDVEGGEIDVLRGANQTILRSRPLMSVEYGPRGYEAFGHSKGTLYEWAVEHDYVVHDLLGNSLEDRADYDACVVGYYWDYLLLPRERIAVLEERLARVRERFSAGVPLK